MSHVIWSNYPDEIDAIALDLRYGNPGMTEDDAIREAYDVNDDYLSDIRSDLNVDVGEIIAFADLGLWDGRKIAYKKLPSGKLSDCLDATCGDYVRWYVDDKGDMRIDDAHHDGTNHLLLRTWRDDASPLDKDLLLYLIRNARGKASASLWDDLDRYTRPLGDCVAKIYGWNSEKKV